ncbi:methylmalonyl Co-A mutase-associated GTPase MeaB [bacterium]|nr:methylmalonyl Co-A mutase-associated GTPase MeaB [bacterium]
MLAGDRVGLAKLLTLVENRDPEAAEIMARLHGRGEQARVLGITGPPGAGKSTLVDRLIGAFRQAGQRVGVVAVDPSSPFSGGAVLGDRIRMQGHFLDAGVFIRSLSARGNVGGLARAAREVTRLMAAFGQDAIIVETVGVGQNEFDVMRLAETVIVVLVPEAGDTVQAMKAGLLEIADIFVVNKADREGAARMKSELELTLTLRPPSGWNVPVLLTVAVEGKGIPELVTQVAAHRAYLDASGEGARRMAAGRRSELMHTLRDELDRRASRALAGATCATVVRAVEQGALDPYAAMRQILADPAFADALLAEPDRAGKAS